MTETSCPAKKSTLLSPWRRRCQWGTTLLLLLIPWFRIDGNSLLRIDIPGLTLYFFGQTLRIEDLYLVLLFSLALTTGFLLITMLLGRVWCGWLCPQTTLTDLAEWFSSQFGLREKKPKPQGRYAQQFVRVSCRPTCSGISSSRWIFSPGCLWGSCITRRGPACCWWPCQSTLTWPWSVV
jgi:polyferredoxin